MKMRDLLDSSDSELTDMQICLKNETKANIEDKDRAIAL